MTNPLPIVIGVVLLALAAAAGLEGWLLLGAHEKIGDLKVQVRDKQAVIDQKNHDADLSEKLADLQTKVETALRRAGAKTSQAISNAPNDDAAARAALDGVVQFRSAAQRSRPASP
jgi:hypothetical protein